MVALNRTQLGSAFNVLSAQRAVVPCSMPLFRLQSSHGPRLEAMDPGSLQERGGRFLIPRHGGKNLGTTSAVAQSRNGSTEHGHQVHWRGRNEVIEQAEGPSSNVIPKRASPLHVSCCLEPGGGILSHGASQAVSLDRLILIPIPFLACFSTGVN